MSSDEAGPIAKWPAVLLTALSLSIGWGIRGNFGHEYGAMIPGALAAMGFCLLSGRQDWWRRVAYFGFFGAVGWSFGGSISYMQVIAYTHSGHLPSVIYGFACLFVIGFIWAAIGTAGTALPACLSRERLTEFFVPLIVVCVAWTVQDIAMGFLDTLPSNRRHESWWYWYDTDWVAAFLAVAAVSLLAAVRRRICRASWLILCMGIGWWVGFVLLVLVLKLRMTPPRGDNWAGALGMTAAMLICLLWEKLKPVVFASLVGGFIGGFGFAMAACIKLIAMKSGLHTNWHSVLEQTYGFINGIGVAVAMAFLATRVPRVADEPPVRRWTDAFAVFFVLVVVTYVNLVKNAEEWVNRKAVPDVMYGLSAWGWFNIGYALLAIAVAWLLARHLRRPLSLVPGDWRGKGEWLYLLFLWWMVIGNFERALPAFQPQRLVTEGVIFVNAVVCTLMVLLGVPYVRLLPAASASAWRLKRVALIGTAGLLVSVGAQTGIVRALYGVGRAPDAGFHTRFGANATAKQLKPIRGQAHP
jgi:hypothetical protein